VDKDVARRVVAIASGGGGVVTGLFVTLIVAVPEDALCVESPEYLPVIVFVAGSENLYSQDPARLDRVARHSFLVPSQNVTDPVGVLPDPFTVADSFTSTWV
jgi:hypothetical protein